MIMGDLMILPVNDNIFNKGFCKGHYLVTVDHGPRIRLPVATVHTFVKQEVEVIFLFLDPSGPRLILCPDKCCEIYIQHAKKTFLFLSKPARRIANSYAPLSRLPCGNLTGFRLRRNSMRR